MQGRDFEVVVCFLPRIILGSQMTTGYACQAILVPTLSATTTTEQLLITKK